ncbi:2648_t:CDS:2, partial [Scutellospora calospora]
RKYKPNKMKPTDQQRNKGSKKTDCQWHVILNKPEDKDGIYVTFVNLDYNHELIANNSKFATAFRKFDQAVMSEIERAVVYGRCDAYTIRNLIQLLFPDQLFLTQDLSNAIQKIKRERNIASSDASKLLKYLLKKQKKEPMMFIQPLINMDSDRLCAFIDDFWTTRNSLCINVFEQRFQTLLDKYPNANEYLHDPIYTTRYS